jgi:hypothetical protein
MLTPAQLRFLIEQRRVAPHGAYCQSAATRRLMIEGGYVSATPCGVCRNCEEGRACVAVRYALTAKGEAALPSWAS